MADFAVVGAGQTGARVARHLLRYTTDTGILLYDDAPDRARRLAGELGIRVTGYLGGLDGLVPKARTVVLTGRAGSHAADAQACLEAGIDVISASDSLGDTRDLLELDDLARRHEARLVVGAGMMPGLSDVLAAYGSRWMDEIHEIHVYKFGTGGPDCARQHHAALSRLCFDWRDERWDRRPGGSGRELAWFPEPVQAADCYRAALPDPLLLVRRHPEVRRVTARMAATRRDRLTMHLPMLRRPHAEGLLGAVRVELRGVIAGERRDLALGCAERPAVAAAAVAAAVAQQVNADRANDSVEPGALGVAELVDPVAFLRTLRARGLRPEVFVGADESSTTS